MANGLNRKAVQLACLLATPLRTFGNVLIVSAMEHLSDLDGIEAARRLAALSPETQRRFDESMSIVFTSPERATQAFTAIGTAIGSKREPISSANKKRLFDFAEQLLNHGSGDVMNAVATCMLEQIWNAARNGGFDFSEVDPYLGPEARAYLVAWDDFNKTKTPRLRRK